ncbi:MAG: L-lactate dehydrogenase (quinone) large subunit LdhH [Selenomonadaceae bacterium]
MANTRNIKKEINNKLHDSIMRNALSRFAAQYPAARLKSYANVDSIDDLRNSLRDMKQSTVAHIEEVADEFESSLKERGAEVFRAKDGDAVKDYLLKICKENNVHRIVKSKSMASEEIKLNSFLEENGLHVRETDLGEWMLSVAGQRPSHMVMPAIHLNKEQCAKFFSQELHEDIPNDIPFMIQTARRVMRDEFLQADLGLTGANFGIAENGAIGLVTNEGNARLTTTLPRIHVILIGYEKLVPKIEDAAKILRLLPRNGTCQRMTSYMTMVDGPTPVIHKVNDQWIEEDRKVYVILLDNGRLKAAHDPKFKEIYQCIRCASCLNVCPIWTLVGGHVYGHIYSGGIGAILTGLLNSMEDFSKINELCIGCRKCMSICPGKIHIPDLIDELRARNVKEKGLPLPVKVVFQDILANRKIFHSLLRLASIGQKPVQNGNVIRHLPLFFAKLTEGRSLPAIAVEPLRDRIKELTKNNPSSPTKRVAFFSGCNIDFVFPETGASVFKVLQNLNMEVIFPEEQTCCGKPILGMGDRETAKKVAKQNIETFEKAHADVILFACPTCAETWHKTYPELFADDPEWSTRVQVISSKVREFTSFVAEAYEEQHRFIAVSNGKKITYHDSCHMKRGLGIYKQPRKLLQDAAGYTLTEMNNCDKCCGMAGAFGIKFSEISKPILAEKILSIKETGADTVAVACPACMMQLQGGLDQQAPEIKVRHVADVIAESIL